MTLFPCAVMTLFGRNPSARTRGPWGQRVQRQRLWPRPSASHTAAPRSIPVPSIRRSLHALPSAVFAAAPAISTSMGLDESKPRRPQSSPSRGPRPAQPPHNLTPLDPSKIQAFQAQTHFDQVEVQKLYEIFHEVGAGKKYINAADFRRCLALLQRHGLHPNVMSTPFGQRLFEILDENDDDQVNFREFVAGMSLLCKGTPEERLELSFRAYDIDESGMVSYHELVAMIKRAWIVGYKAIVAQSRKPPPLTAAEVDEISEEQALQLADMAFEGLDRDMDGSLSFEEFKQFALSEPVVNASLLGYTKKIQLTL